ncbi:MAG: trigger factor [Sedimentisphaerales bacterium]
MAEETKETTENTVKNTVTIENTGACKKKVIIEIPRESINKMTDEQYKTFSREAIVPGFRKGRAPRRLLEKKFGKDVSEQIKLKLLAEASEAAIKDNKIDTLREPDIKYETIELPADGPLKFDFEVEVRPEFELPNLEGIPVEKTKAEVTEGHIDREIEMLRKYAGVWTPKEGGAVEAEDQVVADVMLDVEGQEQKLDNATIQVRANGFVGEIPVEKLDEILGGAKAGDEKQVEVVVPKTHFKEDLRGKKVNIKIAVKDIKWLKPAEMNQDFITKCGVASEEELRKALRERMQNRLEGQAKSEMADQIYKYLLDNTKLELPDQVAADQAVAVLRRQYINLMMQGVQREVIDEHIEQLKASSAEQAKEQLKVLFIMDKAAEKLKIKTTDEEINGHIAQLALQKKIRPERLKEEMQRDGSIEQFTLQVREQKVITKLLESAKITEVEPKAEGRRQKTEDGGRKTDKGTKAQEHKVKEHKPAEKAETPKHKKVAEKAEEKPTKKAPAKEKAEKKVRPTRKKKT